MTTPPRLLAVAAIAAALAVAGCESSSSDSGGAPSAVERNNNQAQREYDACEKQADQIANQQGIDAANAKLDECVDAYAQQSQVEP